MLHIQMDGLIAAAEERSAELWTANSSGETQPEIDDDRGYRIAMVGDSTMRVKKGETHGRKGETARIAFFGGVRSGSWTCAFRYRLVLAAIFGESFDDSSYATTHQTRRWLKE